MMEKNKTKFQETLNKKQAQGSQTFPKSLIKNRAQGSTEFLLLIAGVIVVAILIAFILKTSILAPAQTQAVQRGQDLSSQFEITCNPIQDQGTCNTKTECAWQIDAQGIGKCIPIANLNCIDLIQTQCENEYLRCRWEGVSCLQGNICQNPPINSSNQCLIQDRADGSLDCFYDFFETQCLPRGNVFNISNLCAVLDESHCETEYGDFDGDNISECTYDNTIQDCIPGNPAAEPAGNPEPAFPRIVSLESTGDPMANGSFPIDVHLENQEGQIVNGNLRIRHTSDGSIVFQQNVSVPAGTPAVPATSVEAIDLEIMPRAGLAETFCAFIENSPQAEECITITP
ncbi:MAG: class III signal peptide-containing protein [Candidatus Diapherotrites archaeon]|nr:class III signal peptide-containing protein [Candidatus Diapherotrites archaeon]